MHQDTYLNAVEPLPQIQDYKRNNSKYARLFPAYDDKGFWDQFNKP